MIDIDYSAVKPPEADKTTAWGKAPKHVYFGPRDANGEMLPEPASTYAKFPRFMYAKKDNGLAARVVASQAEQDALGAEWKESPAEHGIFTAPSFEQMQDVTSEKRGPGRPRKE